MSPSIVSTITVPHRDLGSLKKTGLALLALGLLTFMLNLTAVSSVAPNVFFVLMIGLSVGGGLLYMIPQIWESPPGIKHHRLFHLSVTSRGALGWLLGVFLTAFYVVLYWFPEYLERLIRATDGLSMALRRAPADQWFLYGTFYTVTMMVMGVRMIVKNRHSRYQIIRTTSVVFFQLGFAFLIPAFLRLMNQPEFYFTYFWPLKYSYLFPGDFQWLASQPGGIGVFMFFWSTMMTLVATPALTYAFGKRWYCSWVCGCGGLAETLGDPFRHLSDKSLRAWRIERWMIHSVLAFITVTTALLWINSACGGEWLGSLSGTFAGWYGFLIGGLFSGVIGVGFYPLMGSRVWCRFGCPMAAVLGLLQKFHSRFRITTNGGQCISCGNCSTYCEMGIDVRAYAMKGQNIIRASCVGCGICSAVCPRGVLNLENGPIEGRYNKGK
jgi:Pyruvate/2-oxoacid:ferredoxin oxidoreductase delta subunit